MSTPTTRQYKSINITPEQWDEYNQTALLLSAKRGKRVSIPALLREAFESYISTL